MKMKKKKLKNCKKIRKKLQKRIEYIYIYINLRNMNKDFKILFIENY